MKPPTTDRKIDYLTEIKPMRATLVERFPKAFFPHGSKEKRPLAIGIDEMIKERAPDLDADVLKWTIFDYVQGWTYLSSVKEGVFRVDLDGNPVGNILPNDAVYAANCLRNKKRRAASRKKA